MTQPESALRIDLEFNAQEHASFYRSTIPKEFSDALSGTILKEGAGVGQITV
jgi:hypothetical protein